MFPSLKDPEHANVRLKNVGRQVYLCVTQDATGHPVLGTKTLNDIVDPDGEYTVRAPLVFLYVFVGGTGLCVTRFAPYLCYVNANILLECKILDFHGSHCEDCRLLEEYLFLKEPHGVPFQKTAF